MPTRNPTHVACLALAAACGAGDPPIDSMTATASSGSTTAAPTDAPTAAPTDATPGSTADTADADAATAVTPTTQATGDPETSSSSTTGTTSTTSTTSTGSGDTDDTGPSARCQAVADDTPIACRYQAPAGPLEFDVEWSWWGPDGEDQSAVIPLVANLTDDNGDGAIDLCDTPDVVVVAYAGSIADAAHIHVLDGASGTPHFTIAEPVLVRFTPALGDIDGDGLVEIVTAYKYGLVAFEHDGALLWKVPIDLHPYSWAIALADLDADGDVEIVVGDRVFDHTGALLWTAPEPPLAPHEVGYSYIKSTAVADLDADGLQEVVLGRSAYHHDGSLYYFSQTIPPGYPQIADFDADGLPEVLVTNEYGLAMLEHDGATKYHGLRPNAEPPGDPWMRPAVVHDFDGDAVPEYALAPEFHYSLFTAEGDNIWYVDIDDSSSAAGGTVFDLLGDGLPETMYASEHDLLILDSEGTQLLHTPRSSWTAIEYPVVADVDNDGSAEILVVANRYLPDEPQTAPTLQVLRDPKDRWVPARRIWNQHTYHVTNVIGVA